MTFFEAVLLGLVQGLTEFLPVSSSGHLIIVRDFFGISTEGGLLFDVLLHIATLGAIIVFFRRELLELLRSAFSFVRGEGVDPKQRTLLGVLVIGTIPAVFAGLLLQGAIEGSFRESAVVAFALIFGSLLMAVADYVSYRSEKKPLTYARGFGVGLFQALALVPGISRSGSSISGGLLMGLSRDEAVRLSFFLAIPIIAGAGAKSILDSGAILFSGNILILGAGALAAFISGLWAVGFLVRFLQSRNFTPFIIYRLLLAALILLVL